ncbi:MAG: DnaD domain protein [Clostridia bacterium]|nr:DnaD domain protein [Clostridia bacterium]
MSKGGIDINRKEGEKPMTTKEVKRLIEWLKSYGLKSRMIHNLISYIASGEKKYLP